MGWLASIASIAGIAERIITKFIAQMAGAEQPALGSVIWGLEEKQGKVMAKNVGGEEVGLLSTKPEADGRIVTLFQPLKSGKGYDATNDFIEYGAGSVAIAPVVESSAGNGGFGRSITGSFRLVAIGVVVTMIRGLTFKYQRGPNGFEVNLEATGPQIKRVNVRAVDLQGNTTQTVVETKDGAVAGTVSVPLPPGVNLDPAAQEIALTVEIDAASYEAAVGDRRQLELDSA